MKPPRDTVLTGVLGLLLVLVTFFAIVMGHLALKAPCRLVCQNDPGYYPAPLPISCSPTPIVYTLLEVP